MTIKARGGDYVTIDGGKHAVLLTLRGLAAVEDDSGFNGVDEIAVAVLNAHVKTFNRLLVECLVDGGLEREAAAAINVSSAEFQAAFQVVKTLVMQLFPKKAGAGGGEKAKATSGPTG
ncbi:hypothetical protein ABAC460_23070 [Asticcacaulis sp. AC460]|uniref:hypothetical protein n=1 Tax=Asticcacaulis sp. AC460 TaxID=1282360 RepID=UPI0003C4005D|nr:hypothetical protein [Asticcacaulis sp. AC460]ESQ86596.1 hypothetical protein ABAC460_23070 [Asticcacaulis sp. AC460]